MNTRRERMLSSIRWSEMRLKVARHLLETSEEADILVVLESLFVHGLQGFRYAFGGPINYTFTDPRKAPAAANDEGQRKTSCVDCAFLARDRQLHSRN